jgi:hypothetical protein
MCFDVVRVIGADVERGCKSIAKCRDNMATTLDLLNGQLPNLNHQN